MQLPDPEAGRQAEVPVQHELGPADDPAPRGAEQEQEEMRWRTRDAVTASLSNY